MASRLPAGPMRYATQGLRASPPIPPRYTTTGDANHHFLDHGKFVLIFVAGSQHSIMGHRPVLAPLKRLGARFGCARAAL